MDHQPITDHYTSGTLAARMLAAIEQAVGGTSAVTIDNLAPADEFHIGGRPATIHFIEQLALNNGMHVLDIGPGIGGTARYVAQTHGARVTGIDLTPEYGEVAAMLNDLVGLSGLVEAKTASATDMPFGTAAFSAAYMVHVGMNIPDKEGLYKEVHRVLEPGAVFGIYDVLRGPNVGEFAYPVPWASTADSSFLASPDEVAAALEAVGFAVEVTSDRTSSAKEFFDRLRSQAASGPPPLGLHLLMGPETPTKVANMIKNVEAGLCGPWEVIARKR